MSQTCIAESSFNFPSDKHIYASQIPYFLYSPREETSETVSDQENVLKHYTDRASHHKQTLSKEHHILCTKKSSYNEIILAFPWRSKIVFGGIHRINNKYKARFINMCAFLTNKSVEKKQGEDKSNIQEIRLNPP